VASRKHQKDGSTVAAFRPRSTTTLEYIGGQVKIQMFSAAGE
jgi:hypothetical protein